MDFYPLTTIEQIKNAINLQVIARLNPSNITYPNNWILTTSLDKLVAKNLLKDLSVKDIIKKFPNVSVNFVNKVLNDNRRNEKIFTIATKAT